MTRRKNSRGSTPPKYRLHKPSGKAVVTIHGKDHYLGQHGTRESRSKYKLLIADLWAKDEQLVPITPDPFEAIKVGLLAVEFAKYAKKKYRHKNGDQKNEWFIIKNILTEIRSTYGDLDVNEFGPRRFESYRQSLVAKGLAKHTVKRYSNHVKKMFQHGVKMEIIPVDLYQRLEAVGPVEMEYRPARKILPVDIEIVKATQRELTPIVADMVEVQLLTGMRPSEVCNLRPCDINRDDEIWIYEPPQHKTIHHGKERHIVIGPKAQSILNRYLLRDPLAFCFTPNEAFAEHLSRKRENRKTPDSCGNGPKPRKPRVCKPNYDHNAYRRAVKRAASRAFPISKDATESELAEWKSKYIWSPNQLRKTAATQARKVGGLETSQLICGHSSLKTTEKYYAEPDIERAVIYARSHG